jgi:hypothetical protein
MSSAGNHARGHTCRSILKITVVVIATALFAACDKDLPTAPASSPQVGESHADLVGSALSYITGQLLAAEPLIPDGSLTVDDPPAFDNTIHVVDRDNKDSWKIQVSVAPLATFVTFDDEMTCDPTQAPPLPPGALHLVVPTGAGENGARLRSTRYHRTYLRDLTRLDYHACDEENNGQQWPYILLNIDWNGDNVIDESLIFEPTYQNAIDGGPCGLGSGQQQPVIQQWHFWDALRKDPTNGSFRACWWSTCIFESPVPAGCAPFPPGDVIRSLSEYILAHPDAAIVNLDGNHGGVQIVHGFATDTDHYDGWVDAFTIGKDVNNLNGQSGHSTVTYDFQKQ